MNKGFTLVELIAVIAILGLLAVITTPAYETVSNNIKSRNYESKKNTIKYQTISYVEKYYKDEVYGKYKENNNIQEKKLCFSVNDLIHKGIISSDSETEEYIKNDITNEKYNGDQKIVYVTYDKDKLKLKSVFLGDSDFDDEKCCVINNDAVKCN